VVFFPQITQITQIVFGHSPSYWSRLSVEKNGFLRVHSIKKKVDSPLGFHLPRQYRPTKKSV
jgi:hypothetical protein